MKKYLSIVALICLCGCSPYRTTESGLNEGGIYNTTREVHDFFLPKLRDWEGCDIAQRDASLQEEEQLASEAIGRAEANQWVIGEDELYELTSRVEDLKARRLSLDQEISGRIYPRMKQTDFYKLCGPPADRWRSMYSNEQIEVWEYGNLRTLGYVGYFFVFRNKLLESWHD